MIGTFWNGFSNHWKCEMNAFSQQILYAATAQWELSALFWVIFSLHGSGRCGLGDADKMESAMLWPLRRERHDLHAQLENTAPRAR